LSVYLIKKKQTTVHLSDIEFIAPYTVERKPNEMHYTYLDTVGRPVVVIHKKNAVQNHIQDFQVIEIFLLSIHLISFWINPVYF